MKVIVKVSLRCVQVILNLFYRYSSFRIILNLYLSYSWIIHKSFSFYHRAILGLSSAYPFIILKLFSFLPWIILKLWSRYPQVFLKLSSKYDQVTLKLSTSHLQLILKFSLGYPYSQLFFIYLQVILRLFEITAFKLVRLQI